MGQHSECTTSAAARAHFWLGTSTPPIRAAWMRSGTRRNAACTGLAAADGALKGAALEICARSGTESKQGGTLAGSAASQGCRRRPAQGRCCHQRAASRGPGMASHMLHKACGHCCGAAGPREKRGARAAEQGRLPATPIGATIAGGASHLLAAAQRQLGELRCEGERHGCGCCCSTSSSEPRYTPAALLLPCSRLQGADGGALSAL